MITVFCFILKKICLKPEKYLYLTQNAFTGLTWFISLFSFYSTNYFTWECLHFADTIAHFNTFLHMYLKINPNKYGWLLLHLVYIFHLFLFWNKQAIHGHGKLRWIYNISVRWTNRVFIFNYNDRSWHQEHSLLQIFMFKQLHLLGWMFGFYLFFPFLTHISS